MALEKSQADCMQGAIIKPSPSPSSLRLSPSLSCKCLCIICMFHSVCMCVMIKCRLNEILWIWKPWTEDLVLVINAIFSNCLIRNLGKNANKQKMPLHVIRIDWNAIMSLWQLWGNITLSNLKYHHVPGIPLNDKRERTGLFCGTFRKLYLDFFTCQLISYLQLARRNVCYDREIPGSLHYQDITRYIKNIALWAMMGSK